LRSDLLDLEVYVHHITERAALLSSDSTGGEEVWVPLSLFEWAVEPKTTPGDGEITISKRIAEQKGLA